MEYLPLKELKKLVGEAISSNRLLPEDDGFPFVNAVKAKGEEAEAIRVPLLQNHGQCIHYDDDDSDKVVTGRLPPQEDSDKVVSVDVALLRFLQDKRYKVSEAFEKELKTLVREAIRSKQLVVPERPTTRFCHGDKILLWGVPLMEDERTDVILLKFLIENRYKVKESFEKIKNTLTWRRKFGVDDNNDYDDEEFIYVVSGQDKQRRPVCYNTLHNNFPNYSRKTYPNSKSKTKMRVRAWIVSLERMIRKLIDFRPGQVNAIYQVNDLDKCSISRLRLLNHVVPLLERYYPKSIVDQVFVNTPGNFWISSFFHVFYHRFSDSSETFETLYENINPGFIPVSYGGLWESNSNFTGNAKVLFLHPDLNSKSCGFVSMACRGEWEMRVLGGGGNHGMKFSIEFEPGATYTSRGGNKENYVTLIQREMEIPQDSPVVTGSFRISQPGILVLNFNRKGGSSKKHGKCIYRIRYLPEPSTDNSISSISPNSNTTPALT